MPGQTHVLVNGVADRGKRPDKSRLGGRYVAVPLGLDKGARDWSAPLVAGRMYERTQDGGVACYDLQAR